MTRRPRSLRGRLVAVASGSILAAVAAFGAAAVLLVGHDLRSTLDAALRQRAQDVAQLAVSTPAVLRDPGALEGVGSARELAVEVIDGQGRLIAHSLALGDLLLPQRGVARAALRHGRTGYETITLSGQPYRLFAAPIAQAGGIAGGGVVLVASNTVDITDTIHHLGFVLALAGLAAALVAALVAAVLTGRGLGPLRRLAVAAGEIERTADPARRLPDTGHLADEIEQLTGVLNRMLGALEEARAGERRFLADASHELRTPVTSLVGNVEYAARHGADPEVLADLRRDARRLARLVDDLLVLERVGAGAVAAEPVALDDLVRSLVAGYEVDGATLGLGEVAPVRVAADRDALSRALGNLIDNAIVHGPQGGRVSVDLRHEGARALLTVRDEGPGPDPAAQARLFERFWRAPEAAERPGSGLGLSIVAAIAERHHGRVEVDGSAFTLELPALDGGR
jgi:two-component system sensor histidine kinase MprB